MSLYLKYVTCMYSIRHASYGCGIPFVHHPHPNSSDMSSQFKDLEESPIVQFDIKLRVESFGISSTLRIIALFGVIGEGDCFSGSR